MYYYELYLNQQVRKRSHSKGKRSIMKTVKNMSIKIDISPMFDKNTKCTPHVLMELSTRSYQRFKNNAIELDGLNISNGMITYTHVKYGNNIRLQLNKKMACHTINLNEMKENFVIIVINRKEIDNHPYFKDIMTLQHGLHCHWNDNEENKHNPSGMLILLVAKLKKKKVENSFLWFQKHGEAVMECKNSVITSGNSHHGSLGKYFSFGNSAVYKTVNKSSVGVYQTKTNLSLIKKVKVGVIQDLVANELKEGVASLGDVIPLLNEYIAPVFNIGHELQRTLGADIIKKDKYSQSGIWKSVFCINARTSTFHTEDDCSYTVITVPKQELKAEGKDYHFLFKLNSEQSISLNMNKPLTFMFSGKCLTHKQSTFEDGNDIDNTFYNFATYTNKKIFNHVKCSLNRNR